MTSAQKAVLENTPGLTIVTKDKRALMVTDGEKVFRLTRAGNLHEVQRRRR